MLPGRGGHSLDHFSIVEAVQIPLDEERGEERINLMIFLNSVEDFDPLRRDARFRDLVQRIGLPQQ